MKRIFTLIVMIIMGLNIGYTQSDCTSKLDNESCVTFDVVHHGIENPELYYFLWDFGDGQKGEGGVISHC